MRPASDFNEIRTRDLLKFRQRSQPLQCFGWLFLKRLAHPICRTKASASRSVDANTKGRRPAKMTDMTDDWNIARALCCTSCLQVLPSARSFCTVCQTASLRGRASCCKELLNLKRLKMAEEAGKHTDLPTIHKRCPNDQTPIYIFNYLTILNLDFLRFLLILSTHLSLSLSGTWKLGSWMPSQGTIAAFGPKPWRSSGLLDPDTHPGPARKVLKVLVYLSITYFLPALSDIVPISLEIT